MNKYKVQYLNSTDIIYDDVEAENAQEALLIQFCKDNELDPNEATKYIKKNLSKVEMFENTFVYKDYGCQEFSEKTIDITE